MSIERFSLHVALVTLEQIENLSFIQGKFLGANIQGFVRVLEKKSFATAL